ncbi:hypothetical protein Misp01_62560 [Microtetraspora sp. NBRC 13810]|uniref:hypothetical protein n=1 Tax=Microtetraspora sp. NBRC 13810 TaxID=3030990 RepID=UPI0024A47A0A|nr:hypothetical protein [Microtetraspora sp. NBRC 13810]GLW11128.1 hypothetical protein Misp01_62560 [Microtetraspora sp. NBRC 13810]
MSTPTGAENTVLGPGPGAAWVDEHAAHLVDYAGYHLEPAQAVTAVGSALSACLRETGDDDVPVRARLLAVLRRDCLARPGQGREYEPSGGPGMPDSRLIEQAWTLADPLGTETLRLMYRHALATEDLAHVLGMPAEEVGRLANRTQDLIETLVSGLDALAHDRHACAELAPLVDALFSEERGPRSPADFSRARMTLLSHMMQCQVCTRPISIRYTVPQLICHPPVKPLTPEVRQRLLAALPPPEPPERPARAEPRQPEQPVRPASPPPSPHRQPPAPPPPTTAGPEEITLPNIEAGLPTRPRRHGHDTPLYDALRSQAWAREVLSKAERTEDTTVPIKKPAPEQRNQPPPLFEQPPVFRQPQAPPRVPGPASHPAPNPGPGPGEPGFALSAPTPADVAEPPVIPSWPDSSWPDHADPPDEERSALRERISARLRTTTLKTLIIAIAGTAGIWTGIQFLGPGAEEPPANTPRPTAVQSPPTTGTIDGALTIPSKVSLDDFGWGSMPLTFTGPPLEWRITAPGLEATPSSGTLEDGQTQVVVLRALRVRNWCGAPAEVTAPLTLHGPQGSITTTVRWSTC